MTRKIIPKIGREIFERTIPASFTHSREDAPGRAEQASRYSLGWTACRAQRAHQKSRASRPCRMSERDPKPDMANRPIPALTLVALFGPPAPRKNGMLRPSKLGADHAALDDAVSDCDTCDPR